MYIMDTLCQLWYWWHCFDLILTTYIPTLFPTQHWHNCDLDLSAFQYYVPGLPTLQLSINFRIWRITCSSVDNITMDFIELYIVFIFDTWKWESMLMYIFYFVLLWWCFNYSFLFFVYFLFCCFPTMFYYNT